MELKGKLEKELKEALARGEDIKKKVQEITEEALGKTEGTREAISKIIESTTKNIKEVVDCTDIEFYEIVDDVTEGIVKGTVKAGYKINDLKEDVSKFLKEKTDQLDLDDAKEFSDNLKQKTRFSFFSALDKFTDAAEDLVEDLKEKKEEWKEDISEFKEDVTEDISEFKEDVKEFKDEMTEKAEDIIEDIQEKFSKKEQKN